MKIRSGFVSNSSSSSFIILVPTEVVKSVRETLSGEEKQVLDYMDTGTDEIFGKKLTVFAGVSGNYDTLEDFCLESDDDGDTDEDGWSAPNVEDEDEEFDKYEAWDNILEKLYKAAGKGNYFRHTTDC